MGNNLHSAAHYGCNNQDRRERIFPQNPTNVAEWWQITLYSSGIPSRQYLATENPPTLQPTLWRPLPQRARHRSPNNRVLKADKCQGLRYPSQAAPSARQIIINYHGVVWTGIESHLTPPNFSHCRTTQQAAAPWQWYIFLRLFCKTCNHSPPKGFFTKQREYHLLLPILA